MSYLLEEFTVSNNGLQFNLSDSRIFESDKRLEDKSWWKGLNKLYVLSSLENEIQNKRSRNK